MLKIQAIVKSAAFFACAVALSACGQKGDLYLPTEPEAAQRATLPRSILPVRSRLPAASHSASAAQPAASAASSAQ